MARARASRIFRDDEPRDEAMLRRACELLDGEADRLEAVILRAAEVVQGGARMIGLTNAISRLRREGAHDEADAVVAACNAIFDAREILAGELVDDGPEGREGDDGG